MEIFMKKFSVAFLTVLFAWLVFWGVFSVFDKDKDISRVENRALKKMPSFSLSALLMGDFTKDFEDYFSDNFPLRDSFMSINQELNSFYYFSGGDDNTLVISYEGNAEGGGEFLGDMEKTGSGRDDSLARPASAVSDSPAASPEASSTPAATAAPSPEVSPTPTINMPDESSAEKTDSSIIIVGDNAMDVPTATYSIIEKYSAALTSMKTALGSSVRVFSLVTPNSAEFYSPESFHTGVHSQKDMIDKAYSDMKDVITVDAYTKLRDAAAEGKYIYFRTDHHWTALGAYYAYTAFCESGGFTAVPIESFKTGRYDNFIGTMYSYTSKYPQSQALIDNPDYVDYYLPIASCSAEYYSSAEMTDGISIPVIDTNISEDYSNKYLCFIRGDTPVCKITTDSGGPTCVVLKESYGNAFVPFLTSHYGTIYVVDPRYFNKDGCPDFSLTDFVTDNKINDLIVINYPFMINNSYYIGKLNDMIGN